MIKQIKDAFLLSNSSFSYLIRINHAGIPTLEHFGRKINPNEDNVSSFYFDDSTCRGREVRLGEKDDNISLFSSHNEFSTSMLGDYTYPGIELESKKGEVFSFKYVSFRINENPEKMNGLPSFRGGEELVLVLSDDLMGANLELHYILFETTLGRYSKIINKSIEPITLKRCLSYEISLENDSFYLYNIYGHWANEGNIDKTRITHNRISFGSTTGSSCDFVNPFFMVASKNANLEYGDVYGFNLVYSSSFESNVELTPYNRIKISSGIDFSSFKLNLSKDEEFISPMGVITYSSLGLNGIALNFHPFVLDHLMNENLAKTPRPISFNNWEATTFDFDENKIVSLMKKASSLGIELFVLDDGWFGKRNDDTSSLGDWYENHKKVGKGIAFLSSKAHKMGLKFGLWFEPEMVNVDSSLYKAHPDWVIKDDVHPLIFGRNQLVLDLTKKEVCDFIYSTLDNAISSYNLDYIKWDYNRPMSSIKSNRSLFFYNYIKGLYSILERIKEKYPTFLMEACASGGSRNDLGAYCYFGQGWISDDTDSFERSRIQSILSFGYPPVCFSNHVSAKTSLQMLRKTSLGTKFDVAMIGTLGYELDISQIYKIDEEEIKEQIKFYKENRKTLQFGKVYQLSDFDDNVLFRLIQDDEKTLVSYVSCLQHPNSGTYPFRIPNLDETSLYSYEVRKEKIDYRNFGSLVNYVSPIHLKEEGNLVTFISRRKGLDNEEFKGTATGLDLSSGAIKLGKEWSCSGLSKYTRVLGDFGARAYLVKKIN
ncbi:MAG: alpha-galactosidase [Mollicutes bacterium]|nr:alpha-galactosidase [Mollicutes bacterium]